MKQAKLFGGDEPKVLQKLDLAKANEIARQICRIIEPLCIKLEVVGSVRRLRPTVGDLDFVVMAIEVNWAKISSCFKESTVICSGKQTLKINYPVEGGYFQADFYRTSEANFGIQSLIRTGSAEHNVWLASYALAKGFRLKYSEGLVKDNAVVAGKTEQSIFEALGLPYPEPHLREAINGKPVWFMA